MLQTAILLCGGLLAPHSIPHPTSLSAPEAGAQDDVVEPRTEISFPVVRKADGVKEPLDLVLTGLGVRDKTIFNVKVYAFGIYMDPAGARKALGRWSGKSAEDLSEDKAFAKAACADGFARSIRMVFYRDVEGEDIAEAFDDSLSPRIKTAEKKMKMPNATRQLATFRAYFEKDEIVEDDEIVFTLLPGGKIVTSLRGKVLPTIESPALAWALLDVYLGMDPIEGEEEKAETLARLPGILKES